MLAGRCGLMPSQIHHNDTKALRACSKINESECTVEQALSFCFERQLCRRADALICRRCLSSGRIPGGARQRATAFCERYGLRVPVLEAPMVGACPASLAIAVARGR